MNSINMIFIDRQKMFVQGLASLIEKTKFPSIKIQGIYLKAEDFFNNYDTNANVIAIDLNLEDSDGVDFIAKLKALQNNIKIIVLSSYAEHKFVKEAMKSGADGFLLKTSDFGEFETCVVEVMEGKTFLGSGVYITPPVSVFKNGFAVVEKINKYEDRFQIRQRLTKREQEILRLITQAKTNDEIGTQLFISDQTVGVHRKNIMRKLGVRSTMTLIKYAIEHELV